VRERRNWKWEKTEWKY